LGLTDTSELKEDGAILFDEYAALRLEGAAFRGAVYLTGGEYEAHTPQLPPLEQCAHLLQLEQALQ